MRDTRITLGNLVERYTMDLTLLEKHKEDEMLLNKLERDKEMILKYCKTNKDAIVQSQI